ncbi:MAG: L7Ae/L30e/S12e/Gadd45 family ribosomal protein [Christensenellales bacterium]
MNEKALSGLLGLGMRSGQLLAGAERAVDMARQQEAALVLLDAGASPNTRKRVLDACGTHKVPCCSLPEDILGLAIGKPGTMAAAMPAGGITEKIKAACEDQADTRAMERMTRRTRVE